MAVNRNGDSWHLADGAMTDVGSDLLFSHWHHWKRRRSGEPVGFVVATGVIADVTRIAIKEWHRAESGQT